MRNWNTLNTGYKPEDTTVSRMVVLQKRKSERDKVENYFG